MIYEKKCLLMDIKSAAKYLVLAKYLNKQYIWHFNNAISELRNQHLTLSESLRVFARYVKKV